MLRTGAVTASSRVHWQAGSQLPTVRLRGMASPDVVLGWLDLRATLLHLTVTYSIRSTEFTWGMLSSLVFFGVAMVVLAAADAGHLAFSVADGRRGPVDAWASTRWGPADSELGPRRLARHCRWPGYVLLKDGLDNFVQSAGLGPTWRCVARPPSPAPRPPPPAHRRRTPTVCSSR